MSAFQPIDVRGPIDRRKQLLTKMMAQAQAQRAGRPGSFLSAAGRGFKGSNIMRPQVTQRPNVAQNILANLGISGHGRPEEMSPGNGMPIPSIQHGPPISPPVGPPIPVNPGGGGGGIGGGVGIGGGGGVAAPAPAAPAAPAPDPSAGTLSGVAAHPGDVIQDTPTPPQQVLQNLAQQAPPVSQSTMNELVHLGGGWVFDPALGQTYQLPDNVDTSNLYNPFRFGG